MGTEGANAKAYQVVVRKSGETVRGKRLTNGKEAYGVYVASIGVRFGEYAVVELRMASVPYEEIGRPFAELERDYGFTLLGRTATGGKRGLPK